MNDRPNRLHLGCGQTAPKSWLNVDGSWNVRLARHPIIRSALIKLRILPESSRIDYPRHIRCFNLVKRLPFSNETFDAIYASHLLEHLHLDDTRRLLGECFRVLKPEGRIRIVVPDLHSIIQEYNGAFSFDDSEAYRSITPEFLASRPRADVLNRRLLLRDESGPVGNIFNRTYRAMNDLHSHKWMYDAESMSFRLKEAGFEDVEERGLHDSQIEGIRDVELPSRVLHGAGVCVEGAKH